MRQPKPPVDLKEDSRAPAPLAGQQYPRLRKHDAHPLTPITPQLVDRLVDMTTVTVQMSSADTTNRNFMRLLPDKTSVYRHFAMCADMRVAPELELLMNGGVAPDAS